MPLLFSASGLARKAPLSMFSFACIAIWRRRFFMETKEQKQFYIIVNGQRVEVTEEVYRAYVRPVRAQQRTENAISGAR